MFSFVFSFNSASAICSPSFHRSNGVYLRLSVILIVPSITRAGASPFWGSKTGIPFGGAACYGRARAS